MIEGTRRGVAATVSVMLLAATAGLSTAAAATPNADAGSMPASAACSTGDVWVATEPTQAWLPAGRSLSGSTALNYHATLTLNRRLARTEQTGYTLPAQLKLSAGTPLTSVTSGPGLAIERETRWDSTATYHSGTGTFIEPLHENVAAYLFVTGYRVRVTLYRRSCTPAERLTKVQTRTVFLYRRDAVTAVGWVGVGVTPHAVVDPWTDGNITNP